MNGGSHAPAAAHSACQQSRETLIMGINTFEFNHGGILTESSPPNIIGEGMDRSSEWSVDRSVHKSLYGPVATKTNYFLFAGWLLVGRSFVVGHCWRRVDRRVVGEIWLCRFARGSYRICVVLCGYKEAVTLRNKKYILNLEATQQLIFCSRKWFSLLFNRTYQFRRKIYIHN